MPFRLPYWLRASLAAVALAGCTAPVEPPSLIRRNPLPIEKIALGPELDRAAVERIVDALAEGLRDPEIARGLKDAVASFYSDGFAGVRDELQRVVLDEADDRGGLLALLEKRLDEAALATTVRDWRVRASRDPWKPFLESTFSLAETPRTAVLAEKFLVLVDPRWTGALPAFAAETDDQLPKLFQEVARALGAEKTRAKVFEALQRTLGSSAAPALFETVAEAFAENDAEAFAFGKALERATKSEYKADGAPATSGLAALVRLFETLDQPSGGLFAAAETALAEDPALRNLAASLVRVETAEAIGRATARAMAEDVTADFVLRVATEEDLDGPGFQELFGRVLDGFQQILGPIPGERDVLYGSVAPGRILPCFALARWYQAALRAAAKDLAKLPEEGFRDAFVLAKFDVAEKVLRFGNADRSDERTIDKDFEAALKKLQLSAALPSIKASIAGKIAPLTGTLPATKGAALEGILTAGVKAWDRTRPLADGLPALRTLLDDIARGPKGWLATFDNENLWNMVHAILRALPASQLPRVRKLLFEDMQIQKLSPNARELLGKLVEKAPKGEAIVTAALRDLGALAAFAAPVEGRNDASAEPFAFYRRLAAALPESGIDVPGRWFRVARELALGTEAGTKALPTAHAWLVAPERVVRAARWVAEFPADDRLTHLGPLAALFPKKLEAAWLDAFQSLSTIADPLGAVAEELSNADGEKGAFHGGPPGTPAERSWLAGKARAGAWVRAGAPFLAWLRGPDAARLRPLFRQWAENGTWARLAEHFQWVKDARLARWAKALGRAERQGVLKEAFRELPAPGRTAFGSARP